MAITSDQDSEVGAQPRIRRPDRPTLILLAATAAGALVIFLAVHRALVDDAYITLTYARTLALHGDWGLVPGHEANTATSPLNVLVLAALIVVVREPVVALGILYMATAVVTALGLLGLGRELGLKSRVAVVGTPLLVAHPLLVSTLGLETTLVAAAMVHLAWAAARGDALRYGLVAGVLMWLRLDTVVIVVALFVCTPALWRRIHVAVSLSAAVLLPWLAVSWVALGSAIPDTLVIKQASGDSDFVTGIWNRYATRYPTAAIAVFLVAILGAAVAVSWPWWRRRVATRSTVTAVVPALALAGAAYYGLIALLDVSAYFWYYAPTAAALTVGAAVGIAWLLDDARSAVRTAGLSACAAVAAVVAVPWAQDLTAQTPLRAMPIHGNWAYPDEYREIGTELGEEVDGTVVRGPGEIGALLYYCECTMSDRFTDRGRIAEDIEARADESWLMRLNYRFLDLDELEPMPLELSLRWRPGPDPSGRGWNSHGVVGSIREHGHFELFAIRDGGRSA